MVVNGVIIGGLHGQLHDEQYGRHQHQFNDGGAVNEFGDVDSNNNDDGGAVRGVPLHRMGDDNDSVGSWLIERDNGAGQHNGDIVVQNRQTTADNIQLLSV
jgi:hypothetical protein